MGVGHVPTSEVRQERQSNDVPRREHRGARAYFGNLSHRQLGQLGEIIAARFLEERGALVLGRNLRIGRGEIDLVIEHQGERAVVEVKATSAGGGDPSYHFNSAKRRQVERLARSLGVFRVDYVGIEISASGATIRWLPRIR